jgi:hypothetical protein
MNSDSHVWQLRVVGAHGVRPMIAEIENQSSVGVFTVNAPTDNE